MATTVFENELYYCLLSWELSGSYGYLFVCLRFFIFCIVLHSGEGEEPVGQYPAWCGGASAAAEVHADRQHAVGWAEARNGAPHGAVRDPSAYAPAGPKRDACQTDFRQQSKTIYTLFSLPDSSVYVMLLDSIDVWIYSLVLGLICQFRLFLGMIYSKLSLFFNISDFPRIGFYEGNRWHVFMCVFL